MRNVLATASMLAILAAAPAVAQQNTPPGPNAMPDSDKMSMPERNAGMPQEVNEQDRKFVEKAGSAGLAEVAAGEMALKSGADPAVREFGRWMMTDHTAMGDMLAKRAERAGLSVPNKLDPTDQKMLDQLGGMHGGEFDMHYVAHQLEAHKQALELFKQEADSGANPELKMFARNSRRMIEQHLAEIHDLQSLPQSSTARSADVTSPAAAPMRDPKAASPNLQSGTTPAARRNLNAEGAQQIEKEGK